MVTRAFIKGRAKMKIKNILKKLLKHFAITINDEKGFNLVEMGIVLAIVGIIMGGAVMKGPELIASAKNKNLVKQYQALTAAVYGYQEKYGFLPGDDLSATTHLAGTGYTVTNGNGNGQIAEYFAAPEHLAAGGFITGNYNGTSDYMKHTFGGNVCINYQTIQGKTGNLIRFDNLSADSASSLDKAIDDGVYNTGSCRASADYTAGTTISNVGCFF